MRLLYAGFLSVLCASVAHAADLVAHWSLNENAGTVVGDSSANALHGVISGPGVSWAPGMLGNALSFGESADFVSVPHNEALNFTTSFTLTFWIKGPPIQDGGGDGFATIINKSEGGANGFSGWAVYARAAEPGAISFSLGNGTSFSEPRLSGVLDNTWHHVAVTVDHSPTRVIRAYRDNRQYLSYSESSTAIANNTGPLDFGLYRNGASTAGPFEGQLDDLRLYVGQLDSCALNGLSDPNGILDCDDNGIPDQCQNDLMDCNHNCIVDMVEIANCSLGDLGCADCNTNGVLDSCEPRLLDTKLTASDAGGSDYFGSSVSISDDTVVVGVPYDDHDGLYDAGSVYVYVRAGSGWTQQAKLTASDPAESDEFGRSVSISGDTVIVGAAQASYGKVIYAGAAYVFVRSEGAWTQQAKLTSSDAETGDFFGYSVALSNETALVGAYNDSHSAIACGSAYVFTRQGQVWTERAKLTAFDAARGDRFGHAVSISDDTVIVGAPYDSDVNSISGSAYVFVHSDGEWIQQAKLVAPISTAFDYFGTSVSISGATIIVGAPRYSGSGSAHVFSRSGDAWVPQTILSAAERDFGRSVCASGDTAVVTSVIGWAADYSGSAYVFKRSGDTWIRRAKLRALDASSSDYFGSSLSIDGDTIAVGAPGSDHTGVLSAGSAYIASINANCDGVPAPEVCNPLPPGVRVVSAKVLPGDGRSWSAPFASLQGAVAAAAASNGAITQLWVAGDTYRPDFGNAQSLLNRDATFALQNNLAIYGGFACGDDELSDRDPIARPTILSGDLASDDGPDFSGIAENSFHVVTAGPGVDATAVLDGFIIIGGNANDADSQGGGLFCNGGSPTVSNCTFVGNCAGTSGGGAASKSSSAPAFINCQFHGNRASSGAAVYNQSSHAVYNRCLFSGNTSVGDGGAVVNDGSPAEYHGCLFSGNTSLTGTGGAAYNVLNATPIFANCTLSGNTALLGGGIGNNLDSHAILSNSILWSNTPDEIGLLTPNDTAVVTHSDIHGGWSGAGNINADPMFIDADGADNIPGTLDDDFHIPLISPCVDTGDTNYVPPAGATTDIDREPRVLGCRVDMGIDEVSLGVAHSGDVDGNGETDINDVSVFVNVLLFGSGNCAADVNSDNRVDGRDVGPFVEVLLSP